MQAERRALVVAAELDAPEARDRLLASVDVDLVDAAAEVEDALDRRVHSGDSQAALRPR